VGCGFVAAPVPFSSTPWSNDLRQARNEERALPTLKSKKPSLLLLLLCYVARPSLATSRFLYFGGHRSLVFKVGCSFCSVGFCLDYGLAAFLLDQFSYLARNVSPLSLL
ncbi:unnamed protein product, partial [Ectocarpus sp. 12 AP-2014]